MYDEHFGLTGRPFQLTPDARFWYETATHRKAMAYLGYGLAQGEGFVVVTGDIGAGKTTLVGHLTGMLDPAALNVITIVSTAIPADDLLRIVATGLGVDPSGLAKAQLLTAIERGLHAVARTGRRTLLIVDEAQALPVDALEELRMLSNFQAGGHALLQILLLGQPEFRERLHGSDRLEQLRQRVIAIHHLEAMEPNEVSDYIAHRLSVVGWQGRPDFADDAFEAMYHGSGGVPRRLNQLAGRVMLHAAIEGLEMIDGRVVRGVLRDLHADLPMLAVDAPPAAEPEAAEPLPQPVVAPEPLPQSAAAPEPLPQSVAAAEPEREIRPIVEETTVRRFVPRTVQWLEPIDEPEAAEEGIETGDADPAPADPAPEPASMSVTEERIAALEERIAEQEAALRRVLTLLVDWVEADRGEVAAAASAMVAGAAEINPDHVPIRAPAAWDHAA
ncbi:putative secretion ATPase (PEP-CTERM system associated) [Sphingomonas insulae]|uniref:AAA+ ATPase domain-containing protein n=1 Tax=Sphingomonas insulae TaxID=424800 RepID=A0ABN1HYP5_9SPHN|nr:AAA family ATPase [Sphingomonas insulae]NIJ29563.1 putative secretion ATPase (PEP-CTERM system associated) [Sphingomonas insulae]